MLNYNVTLNVGREMGRGSEESLNFRQDSSLRSVLFKMTYFGNLVCKSPTIKSVILNEGGEIGSGEVKNLINSIKILHFASLRSERQ